MATTLNFKDLIDLPEWRPLASNPTTDAAGMLLAWDMRNNADANPYIWHFGSLTQLSKYHTRNDEWEQTAVFSTIGGVMGAGAGAIFVPSHGPAGTVGGTPSTSSFALAALPNGASVGTNQLANSGCGRGFKIRVKGNGSGGSGKTEEVLIIANTSGATPVVTVSPALTFTPQTTDTYELLSGRIYLLGTGSTVLGFWKAFDIATETISGNLSTTNLAGTIGTDFAGCAFDELYVPSTQAPGAGMVAGGATYSNGAIACIQGTAADGTHITGSGMPSTLATNQWVNYQIRIVEDATTPTSVGQRRIISANGSGATAQFTVATWGVTPSSSAKFVVENNNDLIAFTAAATVTYSYRAGGFAADANWSTAGASGGAIQYANPPVAMGAGCCVALPFGITPDVALNARNSQVLWFRGAGSNTLAQLDISAGANGVWTSLANYGGMPSSTLFTTATHCAYDPIVNGGKYMYINENGTQRYKRFDMLNRVLEPWCYLRYQQGLTIVGGKMAMSIFIDGATKVSFLFSLRRSGTELFNCLIQR